MAMAATQQRQEHTEAVHYDFFAPAPTNLVDTLVAEFNRDKQRIEDLANAINQPEHKSIFHHFVNGNMRERPFGAKSMVDTLFQVDGAVGELTGAYWNRALSMTDVMDYMPAKRRHEWFEQIQNPLGKKNPYFGRSRYGNDRDDKEWEIAPLPAFTRENVSGTIMSLLSDRSRFFSERVDGIFKALSRDHVTNCPQGFNKRMILPSVVSGFGYVEYRAVDVLHDLRCVLAKFMGRGEPDRGSTLSVVEAIRLDNGTWMGVDGNSFRMRIYNGVGTAHVEVHPEMAWRLNAVLASLYPAAIPAEFRNKPKRKVNTKSFTLYENLLPFPVLKAMHELVEAMDIEGEDEAGRARLKRLPNTRALPFSPIDKHVEARLVAVLESLGGVPLKTSKGKGYWQFNYDPAGVLNEVICTGQVPDQKSHQYYPSSKDLAADVAREILDGFPSGGDILEPSAGTGALVDVLPKSAVQCIEISPLHCRVLREKGYPVIEGDFLDLAPSLPLFDRVAMNPPFSQGRWQAHLSAASQLLKVGGKLVAILPASAKNNCPLEADKFQVSWSSIYSDCFRDTSVSVVILTASRVS